MQELSPLSQNLMLFININFRIVGYVAEANETREEKREKLKVLKKHTPKPEINFVTVGSYFMCGKIIGNHNATDKRAK